MFSCCKRLSFDLPKNAPEFCYRLIRGLLYAFTFTLFLLGISIICFAFWYIYEGKTYHLDNAVSFSVFAISLIIGLVLTSLSCCGLFGIFRENLVFAKVFLVGMMFLVVVEFVCIFTIYSYKRQILSNANDLFRNFISDYAEDDDVRLLVDTIQSDLKCCGISTPNDWDMNPYYTCSSTGTLACSVPPSCCFNYKKATHGDFNLFCGVGIRRNDSVSTLYQMVHVKGCKYAIYSFLEYKHKITIGILASVLIPQMFVILLIISYILTLNYMVELDHADFHVNLMMNMGFGNQPSSSSGGKLVARIRSNPVMMTDETSSSSSSSTSSSAVSRSSSQSITLTPLNFLFDENTVSNRPEEPRSQPNQSKSSNPSQH